MCWSDYEPSDVWHVTTVRARKRHECYEGTHAIEPGQQYQRISSLYDNRWDTYRICLPCAEASKNLGDACRLYEPDSIDPLVGGLFEALDDHIRCERWRLGGAPPGLERTVLRDLNRHYQRMRA